MCCYKFVETNFKFFGLQKRVESMIMREEERIFRNLHR